VNSGREAALERMEVIDGDRSEPTGDVYLQSNINTYLYILTKKRHTSIRLV